MRKYFDLSSWFILFALLPFSVLALLSQNSVPGDFFYPVKRGFENIILVASSVHPTTRVAFRTDLTERRFREAEQLLVAKADVRGLNEFVQEIQITQTELVRVEDPIKKVEFTEKLLAQIETYETKLAQVQTQVESQPTPAPQVPTPVPVATIPPTQPPKPTVETPTPQPVQTPAPPQQPIIPFIPIGGTPSPISEIKKEIVKSEIENTKKKLEEVKEKLKEERERVKEERKEERKEEKPANTENTENSAETQRFNKRNEENRHE